MIAINTLKLIRYPIAVFLLLLAIATDAQFLPDTSQQESEEVNVPVDLMGRSTPRGTVQGFITAVAEQDYERASQYLNLNDVSSDQGGQEVARVLQHLLDQGNLLPYARISNHNDGSTDDNLPSDKEHVGTISVNGKTVNIILEQIEDPRQNPIWLFSKETIMSISGITADNVLLVDKILPDFLKNNLWGGVPIGQWLIVLLLIGFSYLIAWGFTSFGKYIIPKLWVRAREEPHSGVIEALSLPIRLYIGVWLFVVFTQELGISIILRQSFSGVTIIIGIIAILILLWQLAGFLGGFTQKRMVQRGNISGMSIVLFLQRAAKTVVIVFGVIAILSVLGIDVTAGLAALGIGGLALALGAQKTMENLVGSVTLVADQPIRVGDFCKVGEIVGTIESIGMRSTRIRTLNRTIVTIPNGEFSSAKIENYAHRDRFWFHPILNLRYETTPDQMRYLLVELRSILYAHPKVSPEPARVRFIQLNSASLDIEVFAYVNVAKFDEFLEVQEDLLLRMMDVVEASGTGFAFPSQTIYFARDNGMSEEKRKEVEEKVKQWVDNNELQIPRFDPERIEGLKESIQYPPKGSVNT